MKHVPFFLSVTTLVLLAACTRNDCKDAPQLRLEVTDFQLDDECPDLVVHISSRISGLCPETDKDRKVTVYYGVSSFLDEELTTQDTVITPALDFIIGWNTYVSTGSDVIESEDRRFALHSDKYDDRIAAIRAAKARGDIRGVGLIYRVYQDNRPCGDAKDVRGIFNITDRFPDPDLIPFDADSGPEY